MTAKILLLNTERTKTCGSRKTAVTLTEETVRDRGAVEGVTEPHHEPAGQLTILFLVFH